MAGPDNLTALFGAYPVLANLPESSQRAIAADSRRFSAPQGHVLFDVDSACSNFVLVVKGAIRVVRPAPSGREILLYRVLPGDNCILTVSCLLGHSGYPARGLAESDVAGYFFSQPLFSQLLEQAPSFRQFIFRYFAERVAGLMTLVEGVAFGQLDQRLAAAILEQTPEGSLELVTTHQTLADAVGSVREVVSRTLKQFEQRGLVYLGRGAIRIVDRRGLYNIAYPLG